MKRIVAALIGLLTSCCAHSAVGLFPGVKVEVGLGQELGLHIAGGHRMAVKSNACGYCQIVVYGDSVGVLAAGTEVYDVRRVETIDAEVPVLALCYRDIAMSDLGFVAGNVFTLHRQRAEPQSWIVEAPRGVDMGRGASCDAAGPVSRRVKFPREPWNQTLFVQVVNLTDHGGETIAAGRPKGFLPPRGAWFYRVRAADWQERHVILQVLFRDGARHVGVWEEAFAVPREGVRARQVVLGPEDIRPANGSAPR